MQDSAKLLDNAEKSDYIAKPEYKDYIIAFIKQASEEYQDLSENYMSALIRYADQIKINAPDLSTDLFNDEEFGLLFDIHCKLLDKMTTERITQLQDISDKFATEITKRNPDKEMQRQRLPSNGSSSLSYQYQAYIIKLNEQMSGQVLSDPDACALGIYISQICDEKLSLSIFTDEQFRFLYTQHRKILKLEPEKAESFDTISSELIAEAKRRQINFSPLALLRKPTAANPLNYQELQ